MIFCICFDFLSTIRLMNRQRVEEKRIDHKGRYIKCFVVITCLQIFVSFIKTLQSIRIHRCSKVHIKAFDFSRNMTRLLNLIDAIRQSNSLITIHVTCYYVWFGHFIYHAYIFVMVCKPVLC